MAAVPVVLRPRVPLPRVVWAATLLLVLSALAAALLGSGDAAGVCLLLAALALLRGRRLRITAITLSLIAAVGSLFTGIWLIRQPEQHARSIGFWLAGLAALATAWASRREATRLWANARVGPLPEVVDETSDLGDVLWRALGSPSFVEGRADIELAIRSLALAPPSCVPRDVPSRRAFWINVYNVLARHAVRARRSTSWDDWLEPFRTVYAVAGRELSLDQIEHGLLRNNARPPGFFSRPFRADDPRLEWAVPLDPRVHFALRCGAISCPPIRGYDGRRLDSQLEQATRSFLAAESVFDAVRSIVFTNRILSFYAVDFGGNAAVLGILSKALENEAVRSPHVRVAYRPYDRTWSHR